MALFGFNRTFESFVSSFIRNSLVSNHNMTMTVTMKIRTTMTTATTMMTRTTLTTTTQQQWRQQRQWWRWPHHSEVLVTSWPGKSGSLLSVHPPATITPPVMIMIMVMVMVVIIIVSPLYRAHACIPRPTLRVANWRQEPDVTLNTSVLMIISMIFMIVIMSRIIMIMILGMIIMIMTKFSILPSFHSDVIVASNQQDLVFSPWNCAEVLSEN